MKLLKSLPLLTVLLGITAKLYAADVDITQFGAVGDGKTLNSAAIQKAIDACNASGGGRVMVPAGQFMSGTIVLKNNVNLYLTRGAVILGSTHIDDYQNPDPFVEGLGISVGWALVAGVDCKNIAIGGEGMIDGRGAALKAEQIQTDNRPEGQRWGRRPFLLRLVRCDGVKVSGVTLHYSAAWTSHYFQCRNVSIDHVTILSRGIAHNDGIDIDGCQDMNIKDCDIDSGDDAVCFKTTSSKMPCQHITVSGMRLRSSQGAIKMGTESMAAFQNIRISNCYIYNTTNGGIKLLSVDGAHLQNVEITDIKMDNVKTPILVRLGSRLSVFRKNQDTQQPTGDINNVIIRNVKAVSADTTQLSPASGILITGVPGHPVNNLTLDNIQIQLPGGGTIENARQEVPEAIDKYPEVKTFGPTIPAYGIWARHVSGLKLTNISFTLKHNDVRPAFICEDGQNISLASWSIPQTSNSEAIIRLQKVNQATVDKTEVKGKGPAFIKLKDTPKATVKLSANNLPEGMQAVVTD